MESPIGIPDKLWIRPGPSILTGIGFIAVGFAVGLLVPSRHPLIAIGFISLTIMGFVCIGNGLVKFVQNRRKYMESSGRGKNKD